MIEPQTALAREIDAALEWWRAAGVDCDFTDDVTAWIPAAKPGDAEAATQDGPQSSGPARDRSAGTVIGAAQVLADATSAKADPLGESPPQTLAAFQQWWMEAPGLAKAGRDLRVPPRGVGQARLMVLVSDPEEHDRDVLLSGPQGRLLDRIFAAMGLSAEEAYVASALPTHTPMADAEAMVAAGMDAVLAHHVRLAAPRAIIAFGTSLLPLLSNTLSTDVGSLREINHGSATVPVLMSEGLDSLMAMPGLKARFWRRWIEWSPTSR